jgi:hypothetical protein
MLPGITVAAYSQTHLGTRVLFLLQGSDNCLVTEKLPRMEPRKVLIWLMMEVSVINLPYFILSKLFPLVVL